MYHPSQKLVPALRARPQLNPNYRRLERMEPLTWRKEGVSAHWSGSRGFRKACCKVW